MQETKETGIQPLGWGDPVEKGMANPLQYSCLENSMDRGAWQATVHGIAQSQAQLKRLSPHAHSPKELSF